MSMKGKTLVKGHTLRMEGEAFNDLGYQEWGLKVGRAKCSCGWLSEVASSRAARKRLHRAHKEAVKNESEE